MNFNNYLFRSHMVGSIINVPKPLTDSQNETLSEYRKRIEGVGKPLTEKQRATYHSLEVKLAESKEYKLTDGIKSILTDIVFYEKYGRKYKLKNKYFDKGLLKEKDARDLLSEVTGSILTIDNERRSNEWVTGKRDIQHDSLIIDIKTTWNFETFNNHLNENKSEIYKRQLDCYMDLWNIKESLLCFALVDTPISLIEYEVRRFCYKNEAMTFDGEIREESISEVVDIVKDHIYTRQYLEEFCLQSPIIRIEWFNDFKEIEKESRIHLVSHCYEKERIEQRNECILLCREFMNTVKPLNNITCKL